MRPRSLKTNLISLLLISASVTTPIRSLRASECDLLLTECMGLLNEAEQVIEAKDRVIGLKDLAIRQSAEYSADLYWKLDEAEKKLQSPTRNPFIMATVGLVLGIIVTGIALRN